MRGGFVMGLRTVHMEIVHVWHASFVLLPSFARFGVAADKALQTWRSLPPR